MEKFFFTRHQLKVFAEDLARVFLDAGFEMIDEPYIDYNLCGFRATYLRRYSMHQPMPSGEAIMTTVIHTAGLPFGNNGQKMVILAAPKNTKNEPVSETLKLRIHFDDDGLPHVINANQQQQQQQQPVRKPDTDYSVGQNYDSSKQQQRQQQQQQQQQQEQLIQTNSDEGRLEQLHSDLQQHRLFFGFHDWSHLPRRNFYQHLAKYVLQVIEAISPGLIQLPIEMKLEILKKLSVESILKMSQVNNEFRQLIFKHGESLWRHLCFRDFKISLINRLIHSSWMELYRDTYLMHQVEILRKERALPGLPERLALPPVPYRQQIEWFPEVLPLPFYPLNEDILALPEQPVLALEFHPLRRAASLDSLR